jgi:2'-5' RNA ligase
VRLFIGIEVPEARKRSIEKAIQQLRLDLPNAKWVPRENWHVTLKFLGEVSEERVSEVSEIVALATAKKSSLETHLTEIGSFPTKTRTRVLWVGLVDPEHAMAHLAARLEKKLGKAGFRQESRDLHPHLTLARFRVPERIAEVIEKNGPYAFDKTPFDVEEVVLFRSHIGRGGARYEPLETWPLTR